MHLHDLSEKMSEFVRQQGWLDGNSSRPQTPRNLAISLALESAEALEVFQWGEGYHQERLASELADVSLYLLQLARVTGIDLESAVLDKLKENQERKWPAE
jgi:NTP pyrophosphatase (non-canonical NTP hydrolase)